MTKLYPVIMSGGSGTRLWPVSRQKRPKQYQAIIGDETLFRQTVARVSGASGNISFADPIVICAASHEEMVLEELAAAGRPPLKIILEPCARNTAPVAAIASAFVSSIDTDGIIVLLPADHFIHNTEGFVSKVGSAALAAEKGYLVTLGIQPNAPETGYGYIKRSDTPLTDQTSDAWRVERFVEKPDLPTAKEYLADGNYFWNAGIFVFKASSMLSETERLIPEIHAQSLAALENGKHTEQICLLDEAAFEQCRSDSIDYAVMEATDRAAVVAPVDIGWNDVGAWAAVSDISDANSAPGETEIIEVDTARTFIHSDGPTVAAIGVKDLIIVVSDGAVLITDASKTQDVKKVVESLKAKNRSDLL